MTRAERVVFYGASGYAATLHDQMAYALAPAPLAEVVAYVDDFRGDRGESMDGAPVITFETWREAYRELPCFVTVGAPAARRRLAERVAGAGGRFRSFYVPGGALSPSVTIGDGTIVCCYVTIGPHARIGDHVQILALASVGAGCTIGDFATVCSAATICGPVIVEDDVFVGSGARIVNETGGAPLTIGRGATIGAGAVVTESVPPGAKRVGNPAADPRTVLARRTTA
jgi:sugar O-acyltransferase (sialic acid O-acetyltransferase NeuD family)